MFKQEEAAHGDTAVGHSIRGLVLTVTDGGGVHLDVSTKDDSDWDFMCLAREPTQATRIRMNPCITCSASESSESAELQTLVNTA